MNEIPLFRSLIGKWCLRYPPDGNAIPQKYKDHTMLMVGAARAIAVAGLLFTGANLWTWLIWFPIIFVFNTDDFYKAYEEFWEIRLKKKLTLTQAVGKIAGLWIDHYIEKDKKRRGKA